MNFTAREDYGLRAILDLAIRSSDGPVQSKDVASRQKIPEQFLEQLLGALRRGGLIRSIRGAQGGYMLARPATDISVGEVLRILSGPLVPISCVQDPIAACEHGESFGVHAFWESLAEAVEKLADGTKLQDLVDMQMDMNNQASYMMNI